MAKILGLAGLLLFATDATPLRAATYLVNVGGAQLVFTPASLTIAVGDTVVFRNLGGEHNARADDGSFRCARGCDGHGGNGNPSNSNWIASVTFTQPGTVGYFCEIHGTPTSGMHGTVVVQKTTPVQLQSFEVD